MTVERFEDLRIWQEARMQANAIYDLFGDDSLARRDFVFRDQLVGCAISVMNNIAEGFERRSDPDFARFLDIAKGSNGEVRSMLYLAEDRANAGADQASEMRTLSEQLSKEIESLAKHLRSSDL
jgi:four helix bundle protein